MNGNVVGGRQALGEDAGKDKADAAHVDAGTKQFGSPLFSVGQEMGPLVWSARPGDEGTQGCGV
jgi:hypothetical protein